MSQGTQGRDTARLRPRNQQDLFPLTPIFLSLGPLFFPLFLNSDVFPPSLALVENYGNTATSVFPEVEALAEADKQLPVPVLSSQEREPGAQQGQGVLL